MEGGSIKWVVTLKQWIHQGFTYLDRTEMFWRVVWEFVPFALVFALLHWGCGVRPWVAVLVGFLVAHTLNWVFNFNFWTCLDFTFPSIRNPGNDATIDYLRRMQARMMKNEAVTGCMIYGSLSRGVWHNKSDLDMRIIGQPGFANGFKIYWAVFRERLFAVGERQPLDLYQADGVRFLKRMRKDEFPIFLKCDDPRLSEFYGEDIRAVDFGVVCHLNDLATGRVVGQ